MNISVSFGLHTLWRWEEVSECGNGQLQALNIYLFLNALRGHSVFRKQDDDDPFCLIIVQQLVVRVKTRKCIFLSVLFPPLL